MEKASAGEHRNDFVSILRRRVDLIKSSHAIEEGDQSLSKQIRVMFRLRDIPEIRKNITIH